MKSKVNNDLKTFIDVLGQHMFFKFGFMLKGVTNGIDISCALKTDENRSNKIYYVILYLFFIQKNNI